MEIHLKIINGLCNRITVQTKRKENDEEKPELSDDTLMGMGAGEKRIREQEGVLCPVGCQVSDEAGADMASAAPEALVFGLRKTPTKGVSWNQTRLAYACKILGLKKCSVTPTHQRDISAL